MSRTVVTIGTFDGVHAGHAALIARAREFAGSGRVVAMSFDPHPASRLRPEAEPARLTTFERREALLRGAGADDVVRLIPTDELLSQSPEAFIAQVVADVHPDVFVEGHDFRFGRARAGDVGTLGSLGEQLGFNVEVIESVEVTLGDHTVVRASSTVLRWLLAHGRTGDAALLLGRPYELDGVVERGDRRGRTIGVPTANLATPCMLPADGVYAGIAVLPDDRRYTAAVSVGDKPMFDGTARVAEAYLLDAPRDGSCIEGLDEYDWPIRLQIHGWVRDQVRFASVDALLDQIERDCARVRSMINEGATV